ncbi:acyltransferase [Pseudoalteromonas sp. S3785]|uniref:acyltransferase family protein n=1 Tax=Pseudoalteromonas sp. S3785 TaxID=579545 RepID=UPI00110A61ED|nr:acyltransferase [Pseudoalteromonas sp. S3785]
MEKIKPLQDLRGIAIIMVVLYHSGKHYTDLVSHGNNGVMLFFMISGFIISRAHNYDKGFYDFIIFMKKRISRIHFPYFPIVILFIIMFVASGKGGYYHHDPINIIRNIFLVQNPSESIHPYSWTLVFEMFYYFSFGVLFICLKKGLKPFCLFLSLPPIAFYVMGGENDRNLITSFYNLYFLIGVLIGNKRWGDYTPSVYLVMFLFATFILLPFFIDNKPAILLSTTLFFFTYINLNFNSKLLEKVGNASYTIYLSHAIILSVGKQFIEDELLKFIVLFFASMIIGYIYYTYTERWWTELGRKALKIKKKPR